MSLLQAAVIVLLLGCLLQDVLSQEAIGEPRRRGGGKKGGRALLLGIILKMVTLIPIKVMVLKALTIAALFMAKLALGLTALAGLHGLFHKKEGEDSVGEMGMSLSGGHHRRQNYRP